MQALAVIGLDPGIAHVGVGIVTLAEVRASRTYEVRHVYHETLLTDARSPIEKRCLRVFTGVRNLLLEHRCLFVAMEEYMIGPNRKAGALVLQAEGAILAACGAAGVNVRLFKASQVKKTTTGRGNATKDEVRAAVGGMIVCREKRNEHESDALATAITGIKLISDEDKRALLAVREEKREP